MSTPTGYPVKQFNGSTRRYCRTMDLKDNPELIAEYKRRHTQGGIWPEIIEGIRACGILEMEIYLLGTRLFMIVETPDDFDWDKSMELLAQLPRQQEWEEFMSIFQYCKPGSTATEKWQMMERIFRLYDE